MRPAPPPGPEALWTVLPVPSLSCPITARPSGAGRCRVGIRRPIAAAPRRRPLLCPLQRTSPHLSGTAQVGRLLSRVQGEVPSSADARLLCLCLELPSIPLGGPGCVPRRARAGQMPGELAIADPIVGSARAGSFGPQYRETAKSGHVGTPVSATRWYLWRA